MQLLGFKKWCGANLTPHRNKFAGKFVKSERFLAVLREHIIFNVKRVEVLTSESFLLVFAGFETFC